jgi:hypothetical protein
MILATVMLLRHLLGWTMSAFSSRQDLILENLALRQQILALHAKRPRRRLTTQHKLFWMVLPSGVTSKAANGGHFKTGQRNVAWD